jgi:hypothetical protein
VCPSIYIGVSAADGYSPACTFAWRIEDGAGRVLASSDDLPVTQIASADTTKALHPAVREALAHLPAGTTRVLIVTGQEHFVGVAKLGSDVRRQRHYQKANGKGPLADAEDWKALDAYCEKRRLTLIVSSPLLDQQKASMGLVQRAARYNRERLNRGAAS